MDQESFLLTVSELSLAVVGFSAIVAALVRGRGRTESEYQGLLISAMVEFGFAALLFSLLPLIIGFFGVGEAWTQRTANTALAVFFFAYFPSYQRRRSSAMSSSEAKRPAVNFRIRLALTYLIGGIALLSGWGLVPVRAFGSYALGIGWLLFLAALGFLFTIRQTAGSHPLEGREKTKDER